MLAQLLLRLLLPVELPRASSAALAAVDRWLVSRQPMESPGGLRVKPGTALVNDVDAELEDALSPSAFAALPATGGKEPWPETGR